MKKHKTIMLAAAIMSMIAVTGNSFAQTASPTPNPNAGTYKDQSLPPAQRIALAQTAISENGSDESVVYNATAFELNVRPVLHLVNALPSLADQVIADPTINGVVTSPDAASNLLLWAMGWKADAAATVDEKMSLTQGFMADARLGEKNLANLRQKHAWICAAKARELIGKREYDAAIALLEPVAGWGCDDVIHTMASVKRAARASDALSWAKLSYVIRPYDQTIAGIETMSAALMLNGNAARANQFRQHQNDGAGEDILKPVPFPRVEFIGTSWQQIANAAAIAGDYVTALRLSNDQFSNPANTNKKIYALQNAKWIRNIDGNCVRANAYSAAQTEGREFEINELK